MSHVPFFEVIEAYEAAKRDRDEALARMAELRETILSELGESEGKHLVWGFIVNRCTVTRRTIDTKGLRQAHPEIAESFTRESSSTRLTCRRSRMDRQHQGRCRRCIEAGPSQLRSSGRYQL